MSPTCTAPVDGHRKPGSAEKCPVHGSNVGARSVTGVGRLAPVTLGGASPRRDALAARALVDANDDPEDRAILAEHPDTSAEVLVLLAEDDAAPVRDVVASHPNTPPELLVVLSGDEEHWTRKGVAENPNATAETLVLLSRDASEYVRDAVAEHPNTPPEVLVRLADDEDRYVRQTVAKNPNTPLAAFVPLLHDEVHQVSDSAAGAAGSRICDTLGVDPVNAAAIVALFRQAWWEMTPDDPAVVVALALSPNA